MSTQLVDLYDVFSGAFGRKKAHRAIRDIKDFVSDHKRELATKADIYGVKADIRETELKLTKEIEQVRGEVRGIELKLTKEIESVRLEVEKVRSSLIKWMISLFIAGSGLIIAVITLLK